MSIPCLQRFSCSLARCGFRVSGTFFLGPTEGGQGVVWFTTARLGGLYFPSPENAALKRSNRVGGVRNFQ